MQTVPLDEHGQVLDSLASMQTQEERTAQKRKHRLRFVTWDREDQLQAFFAWLPKELHDAPGIDWTRIPPSTMGYCVRTIGNSPDAAVLALAVASMLGGFTTYALRNAIGQLNTLFKTLRAECQMQDYADLHHEQTWREFVQKTSKWTVGGRAQLHSYISFTQGHFPRYLQRLNAADQLRMRSYGLPSLPYDFMRKHFPVRSRTAAQQAKRRAQSDVLVPLYPLLRQLVRFRKQLAARTVRAIEEARRKVEAGEAVLPLTFSHTDMIPEINRDARTVSEVQLQGREVTMSFTLWDKWTWVDHHQDRYSVDSIEKARMRTGPYSPEQNCFFVQYGGPSSDLLWIGELIEQRLLQTFTKDRRQQEGYQERWQHARNMGFSKGCMCSRPGVLTPHDPWFSTAGHQDGDFLFEPESLYRAVLFGSALAMIALSNGSRLSELLQVSWNKERRITRTETVPAVGADGLPFIGADGKSQTKFVKIHLQHLLPKGSKTEEERQLFPLSKECVRLLGEIKAMLEEAHGAIPVVHPTPSSAKYEHLKPEQYLFQWAATPDGRQGIFSTEDVEILLRFSLHGLDLYTAQGVPIRVSVHVLRHVMATHARQYRHVPPEAIAHFFLHHRLKDLTGREPSAAEISDYYFQMTEQQRLAVIRTDLDEQEEMDRTLMQAAPTPRDLERKNEDLRTVYEQWHTLHPTALGNCGCPGLCPRGNDRSLCLGCSYHVEDPEKLGAALAWRSSYAKQAELFQAQGNLIDARQARIKVQQLDDMINVMRMQLQREASGHYIPVFKVLPSPLRKTEGTHEDQS
jgi:hypothetical protein